MSILENQVSVIICAYTMGRWSDICEAIASLRQQVQPCEVILVIDNNLELFQRATAEFQDVLVVRNIDRQGLSGARNTGIASATGSLIAFLDDDAVADPHWLWHLVARCDDETVLGAGAKVDPLWLGELPAWFPAEFLWTVGCTYRGAPIEVAEVRNPLGGAMVIKKSVLERAGAFQSSLGRTAAGANLLSCEETELCVRARATVPGGRFIFDPAARVMHKVPTFRLTWRYLVLRCFAEGLSKAHLMTLVTGLDTLKTERSYVSRTLTSGFIRGIGDCLFRLDPAGLGRAAAIFLGLASTGSGYLLGRLRAVIQRQSRPRKLPVDRSDAGLEAGRVGPG